MSGESSPFSFNDPTTSVPAPNSTTTTSHRSVLAGLQDGAEGRKSTTPPPNHPTSNPAPVVDSHGRVLNPRSCVTCRKRKVKCDKVHPCSNCARAHIECIFPNPGRAPRRPRKHHDSRDSELLARLRRLEGVVKGMGVEVPPQDSDNGSRHKANGIATGNGSTSPASSEGQLHRRSMDDTATRSGSHDGQMEHRFGRLVVSEGRSRYVNTSFWASLSNEVEDLKGILNEESDEDDDASPGSSHHAPGNHHGWMFSFSSQNVDMLALHPIPMQIETYWNVFKDRVDPLVKVLHIPSITPTILAASSHLANLSKGFEALLFSVYYGATTSLRPDECLKIFGEDRNVLLGRFRFGVEQALARANFLTAEELVILQAFVIFLMCLRRNNDARVIWTLTGLLVRMSQTVGVHRDGTHFGISPFEVEMRRRLWWQICILDVRASEDHGCDPTVTEQSFDTKLPLNVNDADMIPSMTEFPEERTGCTDMSFCLIRYEVANTFRRLNYVPPGPKKCNEFYSEVTREDKERWIQECHDRIEQKYLQNCDMTVPLYWVTATVARLILSKMWLIVYHPFQRTEDGEALSSEIRDKLFITSLENLEYALLLESETRTMKWGWLFKTYMQWHALAFILTELRKRTEGPLVDRAWLAVSKIKDGRWVEVNEDGRVGYLWRPLNRLMAKAQAARKQALEGEGAANSTRGNVVAASPAGEVLPGSIAEYLRRQDSMPSSSPLVSTFGSTISTPQPSYGSIPTDRHQDLKPTGTGTSTSPCTGAAPQAPHFDAQDSASKMQSLPKPMDPSDLDDMLSNIPSTIRQPTFPGTQQMNLGINPAFGADNPSNFGLSPLPQVDDMGLNDMPMSLDANGDIDWANWDAMVRQFGMDVDATPGSTGQTTAWGGPNWNNVGTNGTNFGMGMNTTGWF